MDCIFQNLVSIALRLLTIYVPIKAQKNTAIQSRYKTELKEFNNRMKDSQAEGDNMQGLSSSRSISTY